MQIDINDLNIVKLVVDKWMLIFCNITVSINTSVAYVYTSYVVTKVTRAFIRMSLKKK